MGWADYVYSGLWQGTVNSHRSIDKAYRTDYLILNKNQGKYRPTANRDINNPPIVLMPSAYQNGPRSYH